MNMRAKMAVNPAAAWQPQVQVPAQHYGAGYDDWDKWLTYFWSIRNVLDRGVESVLEVGVGSKVVSSVLRNNQVRLTTFDIDPNLEPDYVGSVTDLPFPENAFDAVLCTEVLEHMPWQQTCQAIREIHRVTRKFAFVTVPHFTLSFALLLRLPLLKLRELRLRLPLPLPLKPNGQHFWECGRPGYPVSKLRKEFASAGFVVVSEKRPVTQYSSCFFVLQKKGRV
jgi:hypothetical protein